MPSISYRYRYPQRPYRDTRETTDQGPKKRDFILFFLGLIIFTILLFCVSYVIELQGMNQMAMGLRVFTGILLFVTLGTGFMAGFSYFLTRSFLKREFAKKFRKIDEEQQAQLRRIIGAEEAEDEPD